MLPAALHVPSFPDGATPALLTRVDRSAYDVLTATGPARVPALPPPSDPLDAPTVGDWLALDADGAVLERLPRRSLVSRGTTGRGSTAQPLAANVDVVLLCAGLARSLPLRRLERLLALAWESGATPVVVLTKADLCQDVDAAYDLVRPHAPGVEVVAVAAADGEVAALAPYARSVLVLLGASGAGKSTVVNALLGEQVMSTGDVRHVDGKGRHTTTHRELLVLPTGGVVIDTPPACGGWRSAPAPKMVWRRPSPTSTSWPRRAGSPTARTGASRAARSWRASGRVTSGRTGSTPGAGCSASSPIRHGAATRGCATSTAGDGRRSPASSGPVAVVPDLAARNCRTAVRHWWHDADRSIPRLGRDDGGHPFR